MGPAALVRSNRQEEVAVQAAFRGTRCGIRQEAAYDLQGCRRVLALQDAGPKRMHVPRNHPILQSPIMLRSVCNSKNRGASFAPPIDERVPKPNSALRASIKKERRSRKRSADPHRPLSPIADIEAEENRAKLKGRKRPKAAMTTRFRRARHGRVDDGPEVKSLSMPLSQSEFRYLLRLNAMLRYEILCTRISELA